MTVSGFHLKILKDNPSKEDRAVFSTEVREPMIKDLIIQDDFTLSAESPH